MFIRSRILAFSRGSNHSGGAPTKKSIHREANRKIKKLAYMEKE